MEYISGLGATLFQLITGAVPLAGGTLPQTYINRLQTDPPLLSTQAPNIPRGLDAVVAKMLKRTPQERYQAPDEVASDLAAILAGPAFAKCPPIGYAGKTSPPPDWIDLIPAQPTIMLTWENAHMRSKPVCSALWRIAACSLTLVATAAAASRASAATRIAVKTPMAPPAWAVLERELLRANAAACRAVLRQILRQPGILAVRRALGRRRRSGRRDREPERLAHPARPRRLRHRPGNVQERLGRPPAAVHAGEDNPSPLRP